MAKRHQLFITIILFGVIALLALLPATSARAEFGTNWTAEYYDNQELDDDPIATRSGINGINFDFNDGKPIDDDDIDEDEFSIRFTSTQTFNPGVYEFVLASDDGARVFIDGELVLDRWIGRPLTTDRFTRTMTAGSHSLKVEYFEDEDNASVQFQWFVQTAGTPGAGTAVVVGGTAAPIGTAGPAPTAAPSGPQASLTGATGVAVRTGPYLGASMVTVAGSGRTYNVLGRNRSEGIYTWFLIDVGGKQGWASGRFLNISADVNSIPEVGSVFDQIDGAADVGVRAAPRSVMNLRARPSIRSEKIGSVAWGLECELIGRTVQAGIDRWYQVRCNGQVGWIDARWVSVSGDIKLVPIR